MRPGPARFRDRTDAGRRLADALSEYEARDDVIVFGLPRGGVPVAYEVADALDAPLDVLVVRKLGVPGQPELAMGAVASGGVRFLNDEIVSQLRIADEEIDRIADRERREVEERERRFESGHGMDAVDGSVAVVVDDGIATGSTMRASVEALRRMSPQSIVVAAPVASSSACREMEEVADEVVCLSTPEPFAAVGAWYEDFTQTQDEDVKMLLDKSRRR